LFALITCGKNEWDEAFRRRDDIHWRIGMGAATGCHFSSPDPGNPSSI
jgi:hypothetical protein